MKQPREETLSFPHPQIRLVIADVPIVPKLPT